MVLQRGNDELNGIRTFAPGHPLPGQVPQTSAPPPDKLNTVACSSSSVNMELVDLPTGGKKLLFNG